MSRYYKSLSYRIDLGNYIWWVISNNPRYFELSDEQKLVAAANDLNLTSNNLSRILRGKYLPSLDLIRSIFVFYNLEYIPVFPAQDITLNNLGY